MNRHVEKSIQERPFVGDGHPVPNAVWVCVPGGVCARSVSIQMDKSS